MKSYLEKIFEQLFDEAACFYENKDIREANIPVFPKYKITQTSDYAYTLELALAGYDKKDIKVASIKNRLSVSYKSEQSKIENNESKYPLVIENHIAERDFEKIWSTNEQYNINVIEVSMKDGILKIDIEIEVPESCKEKIHKVK